MPRYDKYDPYDGGFRAPLAAVVDSADGFDLVGVGINASGLAVVGAGQTGIVGVMVAHGAKKVGDIVDVMTDGEVVEFTEDGTAAGAAAVSGTKYYVVAATGVVTDEPGTTPANIPIGHTVEASRLVVRVAR